MSTVENECFDFLNSLLSGIQANEDSSSFQNSSTEPQRLDNPESFNSEKLCWIKSLKKLPEFNHEKLVKRLVKDSSTMPDKQAPKAYGNMKKGYGLWKEGYVRNIVIKPNVQATRILFLIKARVNASMKSISYSV